MVTVFQYFLMTSGGLLIAVIIKYCDVIVKGMATTIALISISLVSWWFLGDNLDLIFLIGMSVTIIAVFNYNDKIPELRTKARSVLFLMFLCCYISRFFYYNLEYIFDFTLD